VIVDVYSKRVMTFTNDLK